MATEKRIEKRDERFLTLKSFLCANSSDKLLLTQRSAAQRSSDAHSHESMRAGSGWHPSAATREKDLKIEADSAELSRIESNSLLHNFAAGSGSFVESSKS